MLLTLPLGKVLDKVLEVCSGSVWYSFSQGSFGDEWSNGPQPPPPPPPPTLAGDECWLEPMRPCVSLSSMGLQRLLVGDGKLCKAMESSVSLGESTITASGSSWGRDCLLVFIRLRAACRKRENRLRPEGGGREEATLSDLKSTRGYDGSH